MKKLLSILASVGLVATASTAVVSCSSSSEANNPTVSWDAFNSWVNASKVKDGLSKTEVVFVGGKTDADSMSWLAAEQAYVNNGSANTVNYKKLIDADSIKDYDSKLTNTIATQANNPISQAIPFISSWDGQGGGLGWAWSHSVWMTDYFWKGVEKVSGVDVHSLLVDDVNSFFKSGIGKKMEDTIVKQQVQDINNFYYSPENNGKPAMGKPDTAKKEKDREVKAVTKAISTFLESQKGPFFLIFNNGKLSGVTNGFKNYTVFNKDVKESTISTATDDINALFKYFNSNVWSDLPNWISKCWMPSEDSTTDSSFIQDDSKISGWDNKANTGVTYDGTQKSSSDNSDSGSDKTTKNYVINTKKYID